MDRTGLIPRAASDWNFYVPPARKSTAAEPADRAPGLWDKLRCAFTCWWAGSSYETVRRDGNVDICVCSKNDARTGCLWRYR